MANSITSVSIGISTGTVSQSGSAQRARTSQGGKSSGATDRVDFKKKQKAVAASAEPLPPQGPKKDRHAHRKEARNALIEKLRAAGMDVDEEASTESLEQLASQVLEEAQEKSEKARQKGQTILQAQSEQLMANIHEAVSAYHEAQSADGEDFHHVSSPGSVDDAELTSLLNELKIQSGVVISEEVAPEALHEAVHTQTLSEIKKTREDVQRLKNEIHTLEAQAEAEASPTGKVAIERRLVAAYQELQTAVGKEKVLNEKLQHVSDITYKIEALKTKKDLGIDREEEGLVSADEERQESETRSQPQRSSNTARNTPSIGIASVGSEGVGHGTESHYASQDNAFGSRGRGTSGNPMVGIASVGGSGSPSVSVATPGEAAPVTFVPTLGIQTVSSDSAQAQADVRRIDRQLAAIIAQLEGGGGLEDVVMAMILMTSRTSRTTAKIGAVVLKAVKFNDQQIENYAKNISQANPQNNATYMAQIQTAQNQINQLSSNKQTLMNFLRVSLDANEVMASGTSSVQGAVQRIRSRMFQ